MKILFNILIMVVFTSSACLANDAAELESLIQKCISGSRYRNVKVGVHIEKLEPNRKVLYSYKDFDQFILASTMKVLLSAVAITQLGPDRQFDTPIRTDGFIQNNVLYGNIYLVGKGDPLLKREDIKRAVLSLREMNISKIEGNIYYDVSLFEDEGQLPEAPVADMYNAVGSALTVSIKLTKNPSVFLPIQTKYAQFEFQTEKRKGNSTVTSILYEKKPWGDQYVIKGVVGRGVYQGGTKLPVTRPGLLVATLFKEACMKQDIRVTGKILEKKADEENTKLLLTIPSKSLQDILFLMNQQSNNIIASVINKHLGTFNYTRPGTEKRGASVITQFLTNYVQLKPSAFSISDGSGLSPYNKMTPKSFADSLWYFYKNKSIYDVLMPTLVKQGIHPRHRVVIPPQNLDVRIKTGTLASIGVNTMVGYIRNKNTEDLYSFVIFVNRERPGRSYPGMLSNPILKCVVDALK